MRRGAALLAAIVLLVACAEASRVDRDATVTVSGLVVGADGAPLADRPVRLGAGVGTDDGALAVMTIGLSCTTGACTGDVFDATTDASGAYALALSGSETQSTFGRALSFLLSTTDEPRPPEVSGAQVSARFMLQTEAATMPDLRLVRPDVRVVDAGGTVDVGFTTDRGGPFAVRFESGAVTPVWQVDTAAMSVQLDPRLLEDVAGRVVVSGRADERIEGSDVAIEWRSPGIGFVGGAGAPPSRGRPCVLSAPDGASTTEARCPLTDGDLGGHEAMPVVCGAEDEPADTCLAASSVTIELAAPVPAELVVVRGCIGRCPVDVRPAGGAFVDAGAADGEFGAVALDGSAIDAVRVGLGEDSEAREISVWGPIPDRPALRAAGDGAADAVGDAFTPPAGNEQVPWWLTAVAVGAVAAMLVALGAAVGRMRHARRARSVRR